MRRASFALLLVSCAGRPRAVAPVVRVAAPAPPAPPSHEVAPAPPARRGRVVPAPVPVGQGAIGTAHPALAWMTDPAGRWVVLCQPRHVPEGDDTPARRGARYVPAPRWHNLLRPYLIVGGGEGVAIDAVISQGGGGRWLVYRRETRVLLRDATDGTEVDLSPRSSDVNRVGEAVRPPGLAQVADDGRRMVYLRDEGGEVQTVVRELPGGEERVLDPIPGVVTQLRITPDGAWVMREVEPPPTDLAGRVIAPPPRTDPPDPGCRAAWTRFPAPIWSPVPGTTHTRSHFPSWWPPGIDPIVEPATGGGRSRVDEVLGTFGDDLLVRRGHALERLGRDGRFTEIAPAWCRARVLGQHPARRVLLLACTRAGASTTAPLQVYDARGRRSLGLRVAASDLDVLSPSHVVEVTLPRTPEDGRAWISLDTLRALPAGDDYVAEHASRYLVRQGDQLAVRDVGDASRRMVLPHVPYDQPCETFGRQVLRGDHLIDLEEARVRGPVAPRPVAVTPDGRALTPFGYESIDVPVGPFTWQLAPEVAARP